VEQDGLDNTGRFGRDEGPEERAKSEAREKERKARQIQIEEDEKKKEAEQAHAKKTDSSKSLHKGSRGRGRGRGQAYMPKPGCSPAEKAAAAMALLKTREEAVKPVDIQTKPGETEEKPTEEIPTKVEKPITPRVHVPMPLPACVEKKPILLRSQMPKPDPEPEQEKPKSLTKGSTSSMQRFILPSRMEYNRSESESDEEEEEKAPQLVPTDQVQVASADSSSDSAQKHTLSDSGMDGAPYMEPEIKSPSTPVTSTIFRQINAIRPEAKKPAITLPPLEDEEERCEADATRSSIDSDKDDTLSENGVNKLRTIQLEDSDDDDDNGPQLVDSVLSDTEMDGAPYVESDDKEEEDAEPLDKKEDDEPLDKKEDAEPLAKEDDAEKLDKKIAEPLDKKDNAEKPDKEEDAEPIDKWEDAMSLDKKDDSVQLDKTDDAMKLDKEDIAQQVDPNEGAKQVNSES